MFCGHEHQYHSHYYYQRDQCCCSDNGQEEVVVVEVATKTKQREFRNAPSPIKVSLSGISNCDSKGVGDRKRMADSYQYNPLL